MPPAASAKARHLIDPRTMSFGEHLEELRRRLIAALAGIVPIFVLAVYFGDTLLGFLLEPARDQLHAAGQPAMLQVTSPLETIGAWIQVALVVTITIGLPWVIWQVWLFVSPGLYEHERRFARLLIPLSALLSIVGVGFLYFLMLPAMLLFLIQFGSSIGKPEVATAPLPPGVVLVPLALPLAADPVDPPVGSMWFNTDLRELRMATAGPDGKVEIRGVPMSRTTGIAQQFRVSEYINLIFFLGLAFAIGFQMPVIVLLAGWIGLVDRAFLAKNRKYAVFICAVAAAILTPTPDPFSMMALAVPLYILYELGLLMLRVLPASRVARGLHTPEPAGAGDA